MNGEVTYSLSSRSLADYGHLFGIDPRTGVISQLAAVDCERHRDPITLLVVASDGGESSIPTTARVVVSIRDVNDHAPDIRVETTGNGSDVTVSEGVADGEFVAHLSIADADSGNAGRVHCTMPSSQFTLVRMYPSEYKVDELLLLSAVASFPQNLGTGEVDPTGDRSNPPSNHPPPPGDTCMQSCLQ